MLKISCEIFDAFFEMKAILSFLVSLSFITVQQC